MRALRHWSVRRARLLESAYDGIERVLVALDPLWRALGYQRLERPFALFERAVKGLLFDCRMCGQCVLGATGMSCPMNCPKQLRNGPCGGVRADGNCEVDPQMRCVWVAAYEGAARMRRGGAALAIAQPPVDARLVGSSSWLREVRLIVAERDAKATQGAG